MFTRITSLVAFLVIVVALFLGTQTSTVDANGIYAPEATPVAPDNCTDTADGYYCFPQSGEPLNIDTPTNGHVLISGGNFQIDDQSFPVSSEGDEIRLVLLSGTNTDSTPNTNVHRVVLHDYQAGAIAITVIDTPPNPTNAHQAGINHADQEALASVTETNRCWKPCYRAYVHHMDWGTGNAVEMYSQLRDRKASVTPLPTMTSTATRTPTATATATATRTSVPSATATRTATQTVVPTNTAPAATATNTRTVLPTNTATRTATMQATATRTAIPTNTVPATATATAQALSNCTQLGSDGYVCFPGEGRFNVPTTPGGYTLIVGGKGTIGGVDLTPVAEDTAHVVLLPGSLPNNQAGVTIDLVLENHVPQAMSVLVITKTVPYLGARGYADEVARGLVSDSNITGCGVACNTSHWYQWSWGGSTSLVKVKTYTRGQVLPTNTPTAIPTATATATQTAIPSATPIVSPTPTAVVSPTAVPTVTIPANPVEINPETDCSKEFNEGLRIDGYNCFPAEGAHKVPVYPGSFTIIVTGQANIGNQQVSPTNGQTAHVVTLYNTDFTQTKFVVLHGHHPRATAVLIFKQTVFQDSAEAYGIKSAMGMVSATSGDSCGQDNPCATSYHHRWMWTNGELYRTHTFHRSAMTTLFLPVMTTTK